MKNLKKPLPLIMIAVFAILFFSFACKPLQNNSGPELKAALRMQEYVIAISNYAKQINPNFAIVPQNGIELAFNNIDPEQGIKKDYVDAIDAQAIEVLFETDKVVADPYRLDLVRKVKELKPVLNAEFVTNMKKFDQVVKANSDEGILVFARTPSNKEYLEIPQKIINENADTIRKISDAKNYLYIINAQKYSSKKAFMDAIAKTNYDLVMIDLCFGDFDCYSKDDLNVLRQKANGGKRLVLSYVNIGAAEKWRYYWKYPWKVGNPIWIKKAYEGYDEEFYVQFWNKDWQNIIFGNDESYVKKIIDAGFDGAYLDNVEAYHYLYNK